MSHKQYYITIHCNVIAVVYGEVIPWMISPEMKANFRYFKIKNHFFLPNIND